jgi:D-3-phosphoglycerate dehydrogenase
MTPHLGASTEEAQENVGIEVAEAITDFLLSGAVRNAVNLPNLDAQTYQVVKPFLTSAKNWAACSPNLRPSATTASSSPMAAGRAVAERSRDALGPERFSRIGRRQGSQSSQRPHPGDFAGPGSQEIKSSEATDFNEWLHVAVYSGEQKISAAGSIFGAKNLPRIVRSTASRSKLCRKASCS